MGETAASALTTGTGPTMGTGYYFAIERILFQM